jgi:hypothetical protein
MHQEALPEEQILIRISDSASILQMDLNLFVKSEKILLFQLFNGLLQSLR